LILLFTIKEEEGKKKGKRKKKKIFLNFSFCLDESEKVFYRENKKNRLKEEEKIRAQWV